MHIPDNFLSTPVWASLDAVAIPAVAIVSRQAHRSTDSNRLPLLGVMGAFVFAAQMINFPVGLGTSGHLVGGTLLACLLGPWAAALVMTAILLVQALIFQDGGVLALGANIINMALLGVLAGYLPAQSFSDARWKSFGTFLGGTCSVLVSGVLALSELLLSGIRMPRTLIGVSLALFAVNAVIEGAITVSVLRAIGKLSPALTGAALHGTRAPVAMRPVVPRLVSGVALASVTLTAVGIWMASKQPDGLEHLAEKLGLPFGVQRVFRSPLSDYQIATLGGNWFGRAGAGLVGLVLIYVVCAVGGHLIARGRRSYS
jgi:cobalt/nickel transport system permease protein